MKVARFATITRQGLAGRSHEQGGRRLGLPTVVGSNGDVVLTMSAAVVTVVTAAVSSRGAFAVTGGSVDHASEKRRRVACRAARAGRLGTDTSPSPLPP